MKKEKVLKAEYGSDKTPLKLGNNTEIPCYVLEDGTRVLSGRAIQKAIGYAGSSGDWLKNFVNGKAISTFIKPEIIAGLSERIKFTRIDAGGSQPITYGYEATKLIDLCDALLDLKKAGVLKESQVIYAEQAEIIIRSVAKVGIIALVDEATGYQYKREKDELQKILSAYISDEILKWQLTFTDEFYKEVYRLWGLPFIPKYIKNKPSFIGKLTTKYVYDLLPKGVVEKIKEQTGKTEKGNWKYKWHQSLKPEIGKEHLKKQIIEITTLMSISLSKEQFNGLFEQKYHKKPVQLLMEFNEQLPKAEKLSDHNRKLLKALNYNPKDGEREETKS